jgi:hypothetical protein
MGRGGAFMPPSIREVHNHGDHAADLHRQSGHRRVRVVPHRGNNSNDVVTRLWGLWRLTVAPSYFIETQEARAHSVFVETEHALAGKLHVHEQN